MSPPDASAPPFDPGPVGGWVRAAIDSYRRQRAPDQREAFWKAVALGYGGISTNPSTPLRGASPAPGDASPASRQT